MYLVYKIYSYTSNLHTCDVYTLYAYMIKLTYGIDNLFIQGVFLKNFSFTTIYYYVHLHLQLQ